MLKSWMNPKWRMITFLVLINMAWLAATWAWTEREAWMWITPFALSINFLLLTYDQVLTFSHLTAQPLAGRDAWGILKSVHQQAEKVGVLAPQIFMIDSPSAQIFSYNRSRKHSRLFVTEGALRLLSASELEAAVTYQLVAIKCSMTVLNYWVGAVLDIVYRIGVAMGKATAFIFGWTPGIGAILVKPVLWLFKHLFFSAEDFRRMDSQTVSYLERPEDLARAMWKMDAYAQTQPLANSWIFAHMCLVSPLEWKSVPLQVQPPLKSRIKNLLGRWQI